MNKFSTMKKNKIVKYSLILFLILIILLGIYYLCKCFTTQKDYFSINSSIASSMLNSYTGEPVITRINGRGSVYIDIETIPNTTPCQYITSNNISLYGTDNTNLYYFNIIDNKWYTTNITSQQTTITKPDFASNQSANTSLINCRFKTTLSASKFSLWYYNQLMTTNCLYYINLDENGTPIMNDDTNLVNLNCLSLPIVNNKDSTSSTIIHDRIKIFAAHKYVLFAVGCEKLDNPTTIYYCTLTDGIPNSNDSSAWNTIQTQVKSEYIKNIIVNDKYVFLYIYGNDTNPNAQSIYYSYITFNSDDTFNSNWKQWNTDLLTTYSFDYIVMNNDIFMGFQNYIDGTTNSIVSKVFWHPLIVNNDNIEELKTNLWNNLNLSKRVNILGLQIYNNKLIGYNNEKNSNFFVVNLYGYTNTDAIASTLTSSSIASTNLPNTTKITNTLLSLFNDNISGNTSPPTVPGGTASVTVPGGNSGGNPTVTSNTNFGTGDNYGLPSSTYTTKPNYPAPTPSSTLYISPMTTKNDNNAINKSNNERYLSRTSTSSKNIESYFYPMVNVI